MKSIRAPGQDAAIPIVPTGTSRPVREGIACLCAGVTHAEIDEAVQAGGATVESLGASLGCGLQCGTCLPAIREALGETPWFGGLASATPLTRTRSTEGLDQVIFRVEIALDGSRPYPQALPGQHVVLRARTDDGVIERTYTVVAQDLAARTLTLAIRRNPSGRLTPWLLPTSGDPGPRAIEVSAPAGPALGSGGRRPDVFLAGGVGVTPAIAMMNALAPTERMHLVYSVAHADDVAFLPELEARRKDRPFFRFSIRDTSESGQIEERHIRQLVTKYPDGKFYLCGPEGFVQMARKGLKRAGVDGSRVHVELFALGAATKPAGRIARTRAYFAGAMLALLPPLVLLPSIEQVRPHGHPNVGHEQLQCVACHVESSASLRQALQAKVKHVLGLRQTGAVMGMQPVTSATCIQCHANPDDPHAVHRFLEPRFEQARAETGAQECVSCHREHSGARVTIANTGFCVSCHQDVKIKDDKIAPTHDQLLQAKRWDTCMQCHDYHGNHRWNTPLKLQDASSVELLTKYLQGGPSPYGPRVLKAREPLR